MPMTDEVEILTATECGRVHEAVHDLRGAWTRRRPGLPFFTLGAASYLDAAQDGFIAYVERAAVTNPVLASHFGWLQERLLEAVSDLVGAPAVHAPVFALPGFHIFEYHQGFARPIASKHFDLQYERLNWTGIGEPEPERQLSLTLSIRLPSGGAALRLWHVGWDEVRNADADERRRLAAAHRTPELRPYNEGRLAVHSGHLLHQIAPFTDPRPGDERLTLQAHALPVDSGDRWIVYW